MRNEEVQVLKKRLTMEKRRKLVSWLFILPATLLIAGMSFYPMIKAFLLSFTKGFGKTSEFVGTYNYQRLFQDSLFKTSLGNTFIYLILQVPLMLLLALILASLLNNPKIKCKGLFRTMIFLPCATSLVSYSIIFRSMFALDGFANSVLMNLNMISRPINWLGEIWPARIIIVLAITWRWTGYNMIFYLSGLQNIDPQVYEAAKIDGASVSQQFRKITIPLLRPIILLTAIMSTNGTLQLFDETKNLTNGGPANMTISISQYIYKLSFEYSPQFGYAATISFIVFLLVAVLSFLQMKVGDKRD